MNLVEKDKTLIQSLRMESESRVVLCHQEAGATTDKRVDANE